MKLVDYSFSSEGSEDNGNEDVGNEDVGTAEDEELLDETISDSEIGIVEEDDDCGLPVNIEMNYSPNSEVGTSPIRNQDLHTPPSQPSSAPSSPPSAPASPSAFGPRTPNLSARPFSASRDPNPGPTESPFRRPVSVPQDPPTSQDIPAEYSMRGALTHRLNKLAVENKTRNPVPEYLKVALAEKNVDRGVKFTLSHLMNDQMLLDNYLLKKNKGPIERKKGMTINWQCVSQNCYFRATTVDADLEKTNGGHNHDPNMELFIKREGRLRLKEAVAASDAPLASVVMNVVAGTSEETYLTAHGSNEAMKQCARRFKQSQFPDLGKQLAIKVHFYYIVFEMKLHKYLFHPTF